MVFSTLLAVGLQGQMVDLFLGLFKKIFFKEPPCRSDKESAGKESACHEGDLG